MHSQGSLLSKISGQYRIYIYMSTRQLLWSSHLFHSIPGIVYIWLNSKPGKSWSKLIAPFLYLWSLLINSNMEMYKFFPNYAIWYNSHMFLPYITNPFIHLHAELSQTQSEKRPKKKSLIIVVFSVTMTNQKRRDHSVFQLKLLDTWENRSG